MKVYELIAALSECAAGADVRLSGWFTESELDAAVCEADIQCDEKTVNKCVEFGVGDVCEVDEKLVQINIQNESW